MAGIGALNIVPWIIQRFVDIPEITISAAVLQTTNSTVRITIFNVSNGGLIAAEDVRITYFAAGEIMEPVLPLSPEEISYSISKEKNMFVATLPRIAPESRIGFGIWVVNATEGYKDEIWVTHKNKMTELTVDPELTLDPPEDINIQTTSSDGILEFVSDKKTIYLIGFISSITAALVLVIRYLLIKLDKRNNVPKVKILSDTVIAYSL